MSIFDDIQAKAQELMGGAEDITGGLSDLGDQAQDILPGQGEDEQK
jgi:hypothetical protein